MATLAHSPSQAQRATTATQAAQSAADKSHPAPPLPPHPLLCTPTQAAQRTPHGIQTPFRGPFPLVPPLPLIQTHGVPRAQAPSPQTHHPDVLTSKTGHQATPPNPIVSPHLASAQPIPPLTTFCFWLLRGTARSASTSPRSALAAHPSPGPTSCQPRPASYHNPPLPSSQPGVNKPSPSRGLRQPKPSPSLHQPEPSLNP